MATSRCPLASPEDSFWSHVRFKPTTVCNKALSNTVQNKPHGEIAVSVQVVWFQEHMMISDGDHDRRIKKAALRVSPVRSLEIKEFLAEGWWARSHSFWSHGRFKPTEKKQHGAQQLVLLVKVCLETHPCPAQAHVEISVSSSLPTLALRHRHRTLSLGQSPLVCLTCPRGGTATPTPVSC